MRKEKQKRQEVAVITTLKPQPPAKHNYLTDAALIGLMIGAMFYAPYAQTPWLPWGIASGAAGLLAGRGVDLGNVWAQYAWMHNSYNR